MAMIPILSPTQIQVVSKGAGNRPGLNRVAFWTQTLSMATGLNLDMNLQKKNRFSGMIFVMILFFGCADINDQYPRFTGTGGSAGEGAIVFLVKWPTGPNLQVNELSARELGSPDIDCSALAIETVTFTLYNGSGKYLNEASWLCTMGEGVVNDVPAGVDIQLVVLGKRLDSDILYRGEVTGITVIPGQTSDAGVITTHIFTPILSGPLNITGVANNNFTCKWGAVTGATEYRIVVSENSSLSNPIVNHITSDLAYTPSGLLDTTTFYWRIFSRDAYGNDSAGSGIWSFVTMQDTDGDGVLNDGNSSGRVGDAPCTGGETKSCDDNCPEKSNSDQADSDLDGIGDACDETIGNRFGMIFNYIPAGTFMMGSGGDELGRSIDETPHRVTLTRSFYMQTTEVTQAQWGAVVTQAEDEGILGSGELAENPSYHSSCGFNCPVEQVSWGDVRDFISVLNKMGEGSYRLPTEAEWEYASRAGSKAAFASGEIAEVSDLSECSGDTALGNSGWYCDNSGSTPQAVGQKDLNAWGLYDMHGNVWEWCKDWYGAYPGTNVFDPEGPVSGSAFSGRVFRGGCASCKAWECRSAVRRYGEPGSIISEDIGFRLLRAP